MGGRCSMKSWIAQGLGRSDGVHFSRIGYEKSANDLYDNLMVLLGKSNSYANVKNVATHIHRTQSPTGTVTISNSHQGKAVICTNGKCSKL